MAADATFSRNTRGSFVLDCNYDIKMYCLIVMRRSVSGIYWSDIVDESVQRTLVDCVGLYDKAGRMRICGYELLSNKIGIKIKNFCEFSMKFFFLSRCDKEFIVTRR